MNPLATTGPKRPREAMEERLRYGREEWAGEEVEVLEEEEEEEEEEVVGVVEEEVVVGVVVGVPDVSVEESSLAIVLFCEVFSGVLLKLISGTAHSLDRHRVRSSFVSPVPLHLTHCDAPCISDTVPSLHRWHSAAPATPDAVPGAHGVQTDAPAAAAVPAGQGIQTVPPAVEG